MHVNRGIWAASSVVVGLAGLSVGHATAAVLGVRRTPVVAVTEWFIDRAPGSLIETGISWLGRYDKPVVIAVVVVVLLIAFVGAGLLARRSIGRALWIYAALGAVGMIAILTGRGQLTPQATMPVIAGMFTWLLGSHWVFGALDAASREEPAAHLGRRGLVAVGGMAFLAVASSSVSVLFNRTRNRAELAREMLRLPITNPAAPTGTSLGVADIAPWRTPNDDFYTIHTALAPPTIDPKDYQLRIHGMVDRELVLSYTDLTHRTVAEGWATINCVSNEVGGDLIGNAWWSGVLLSELLAEAGVQPGADAILQTSQDGWTCGTPLSAVTDPDTMALLAFGMNGKPLPLIHGFPVRTIVPGLYGFVSACKWVVDIEVTQFGEFVAYWTDKGWAEQAPVKLASRIDVPRNGEEVPVGPIAIGGSAWEQHTGIERVEISLDGGPWTEARLGEVPNSDTWVQWVWQGEVNKGDHVVRVRAVDALGNIQTDVVADVVPDGATGLHEVAFTAG